MSLVRKTESLCPACLKKVSADIVEENGDIYMDKTCAEHGRFKTVVWRENADKYLEWIRMAGDQPPQTFVNPKSSCKGCPQDCGYCKEHRQDLCSAALMVTGRCNLDCPVCFTRGTDEVPYHPALASLKATLRRYLDLTGSPYPLEFCGGEPTIRDDLPQLASYAKSLGFDYIQLNTNGIRIAEDPAYLESLKIAGVTTVYLSFDGFKDETYRYTCGRSLLELKLKAVENCQKTRIAVVLVPVVLPGRNENELGSIIAYAKEHTPVVKGVFFQPMSYFGQVPRLPPEDADRITIPELMDLIEIQSKGTVKRCDFLPPLCEHPLCSFNGLFLVRNKRLYPMTQFRQRLTEKNAAARARRITKRTWTYNDQTYLTISGMAFQDVWNIDLERLKRCTIGILSEEAGVVPLCIKYLTSQTGEERLYPRIA